MSKSYTVLADSRRQEILEATKNLPDREMCEIIRGHFESHPTLPGEKELKDKVNNWLNEKGVIYSKEEKEVLAAAYSRTRIRETPLAEGNKYFDFRTNDLSTLKAERIKLEKFEHHNVNIDSINVELQKSESGKVYVMAEQYNTPVLKMVGTLPENFLKNSPMNVDSCQAAIQLVDYSNGALKNVSVSVVVDSDLMSGDVVDLREDMLAGLDMDEGLEQ